VRRLAAAFKAQASLRTPKVHFARKGRLYSTRLFEGKMRMRTTTVAILCTGLLACGGGGSSHDPKAPFGAIDHTIRTQFTGTFPGMTATKYVSGAVGQKTLNGKTWDLYKIAHDLPAGTTLGADTHGTEVYGSGLGTDRITFSEAFHRHLWWWT
jgi:hypothetical protein